MSCTYRLHVPRSFLPAQTTKTQTKTKTNTVCCMLLLIALCSDQPKSSLHSFSLLLILLGLTAISAYLCLFVVRVLSGLVSVSPSGVSTVSRCSPWSHAGHLTPGSLTRGLKHNPLNMCRIRGLLEGNHKSFS